MDHKFCKKCDRILPVDQFYKKRGAPDGLRHYCKECGLAYNKAWYERSPEKQKAYVRDWRERNPEKQKAYNKAWRERNPEKQKAYNKAWRESNPEKCNASSAASKIKFPEKAKARRLLNRAVHTGKVIRPDECSKCSIDGIIHGHHEDYAKPLDVIWLCSKCHSAAHREE